MGIICKFSSSGLLILFFCMCGISSAQKGFLYSEDENGDALPGVYVRDLNNPSVMGITEYGKFQIKDTDFSTNILLQRFGYKDKVVNIDLKSPNYIQLEKEVFPDGLIYYNSMDKLDKGLRTNELEVYGNFDTKTENGVTEFTSGANQTRFYIDDTEDAFGNGNSLRVLYPKNKVDSKESGIQWRGDLHGEYTEMYVSYWVKFSDNFTFTLGGKLPGLAGSEDVEQNDNEFSGKLMWRDNGKMEFYLHPTSSGVDGSSSSDAGKIRGWWNRDGQAYLRKGEWEHIEIYYKLNTPGSANGVMKGWLNGELKGQKTNVEFRGSGESNIKINQFFFSSFFGGNESYAPSSPQYAWFDDFRVSPTRMNVTTPLVTSINTEAEIGNRITKTSDFTYDFPGEQEWTLFNQMGVKVNQSVSKSVDVSGLASGLYVLKTANGSFKIIR